MKLNVTLEEDDNLEFDIVNNNGDVISIRMFAEEYGDSLQFTSNIEKADPDYGKVLHEIDICWLKLVEDYE